MAIQVSIVGLDIANSVFQLHGVDRRKERALRKRLRRGQVCEFLRSWPMSGRHGSYMKRSLLGACAGGLRARCAADRSAVCEAVNPCRSVYMCLG